MSCITELKMRGKKLVEVFIDGNSIGRLNVEAVVANGLKTGVEVDIEKLKVIQFQSNLILAKEKALNLISKFPHTEKEVKNKLKASGFGENVCDACINFLNEYKYLNDENYTKLYIEQKGGKIGKNKLSLELYKKGVSKELIDLYLNGYESDKEEIYNILKKFMSNKEKNIKNKTKAYRFLYSRGFVSEDCVSVINKYFDNEDNNDWDGYC